MSNTPHQTPEPAETLLDGITLSDVIVLVRRVFLFLRTWYLYILAGALILGVIGAGAGLLLPSKHVAVFEVRLIPKVSDNPVAAFSRANLEFFASPEQNFRAIPLIEETARACGIDLSDPRTAGEIQKSLQIYQVGHNTYRGSYSADDAESALKFLDVHANVYRDTEIRKTLGTIEAEMSFLSARLLEVEGELEKSESDLQEFQEKHADGLPEQAELHYNTLRGLQGRKIENEAALEQVALELKLNREKLAGEKLFVESKVISTQRKTPFEDAVVDLKKELAKARAAGMNDAHPKVKTLESLITRYAELASEESSVDDTETEKTRNPIFESIQDTVYQLEVRETVTRKSYEQVLSNLERVTTIVGGLPELQRRYAQLTRNYDTTADLQRRIYNQFKVTELQLALEREAAASRYDIIAPPMNVYTSTLKRAMMLAVLGCIAGAFLGMAFGIYREMKDYVISRT